MHGIGNDFVVVNCLEDPLPEDRLSGISKKANDRKFGIGGDGLILVLPSRVADFRMRMFNPDGSEAEMCGNGIRCFAKYVFDRRISSEKSLKIETLAGTKIVKLNTSGGRVESVRVDMGQPHLIPSEVPMRWEGSDPVIGESIKVDGRKFEITAVSMGNPHAVVFESNGGHDIERYGPLIENHRLFPQRTNVHFVKVCANNEISIRTWERGAGITLACGTGACASVVAAALNNKTGKLVTAHLPGGDLTVEWLGDNRIMMQGPAEEVFEGEFPL
jgi:diaminopimelate epimerase